MKKCTWSVSTDDMWPGRSRTSDSWICSQTRSRCQGLSCNVYMRRRMTKPTKWPLRPAETQTACASAQSDQSLRCPHEETLGPQLPIERTAKTLIRLGGAQGSLVRAPALLHTGYTCNLRRISHDIMYMVFLLFPLIQERQFLIISESICTLDHFVPVNCLEGLRLSARRSGLNRSFNCIPEIHRP